MVNLYNASKRLSAGNVCLGVPPPENLVKFGQENLVKFGQKEFVKFGQENVVKFGQKNSLKIGQGYC